MRCKFCASIGQRLGRTLRNWAEDSSGSVAVMFAMVFSALLLVTAVAIDFARGTSELSREQFALDTAALAATDKMGLPNEEAAIAETAHAFFEANAKRTNSRLTEIKTNPGEGTISGTSGGLIHNMLMKIFGTETTHVSAHTRVAKSTSRVEVVLVLDNSADLAGQPLTDLKNAAKNLVGLLFQSASVSDDIRIGIVPFSGAVNVGPGYRGQPWIDNSGLAPTHYENMQEQVPRFTLFDRMGKSWAGCVEVRPSPYDVTDAPPTAGNPATLFVPLFAPDEPDDINAAGDTYTNNYLPDAGGTCTPQNAECKAYSRRGNCTNWSTPPIPVMQAQRQTCKYSNTSLDTASYGPLRKGPNMLCDSAPLTRLTGRRSELVSAIDAMQASGRANIGEGVMWGWRVLSPEAPFADGAAYQTRGVRKIMIVLARGANWAEGLRNVNDSTYTAWGYGVENRLSPQSHTSTSLTNSMNEMTRAACRSVTDKGVEVYSIGFGQSDAHTRSMLQYCASNPHMNFDPKDFNELMAVFEGISKMSLQLRIAG